MKPYSALSALLVISLVSSSLSQADEKSPPISIYGFHPKGEMNEQFSGPLTLAQAAGKNRDLKANPHEVACAKKQIAEIESLGKLQFDEITLNLRYGNSDDHAYALIKNEKIERRLTNLFRGGERKVLEITTAMPNPNKCVVVRAVEIQRELNKHELLNASKVLEGLNRKLPAMTVDERAYPGILVDKASKANVSPAASVPADRSPATESGRAY